MLRKTLQIVKCYYKQSKGFFVPYSINRRDGINCETLRYNARRVAQTREYTPARTHHRHTVKIIKETRLGCKKERAILLLDAQNRKSVAQNLRQF